MISELRNKEGNYKAFYIALTDSCISSETILVASGNSHVAQWYFADYNTFCKKAGPDVVAQLSSQHYGGWGKVILNSSLTWVEEKLYLKTNKPKDCVHTGSMCKVLPFVQLW